MPIAPIYAASKAALAHFVRSAAPALARRGVRLCAVCPQPVDTPMVREMMAQGSAMPQDTGASLITPDRVLQPCPFCLAVLLLITRLGLRDAMPQDTGASLITPDRVLQPCPPLLAVLLLDTIVLVCSNRYCLGFARRLDACLVACSGTIGKAPTLHCASNPNPND